MLRIMILCLNPISNSQLKIILSIKTNIVVHERKYFDQMTYNRHNSYLFIFLIMIDDGTNTCKVR